MTVWVGLVALAVGFGASLFMPVPQSLKTILQRKIVYGTFYTAKFFARLRRAMFTEKITLF